MSSVRGHRPHVNWVRTKCQQGEDMTAIDNLLDKCRENGSVASDNALAKKLGVSRQSVSSWRHGVRLPDTVTCARIAQLANEPLARVLGIVGEARAINREEKQVWRSLAQSVAAGFAVIALLAVMTPDAQAATSAGVGGASLLVWILRIMCIMFIGICLIQDFCRRLLFAVVCPPAMS
jgi:transcriptional regulator with XRE-family HTH domain